jgi:hypothetical protein
MEESAQHVVSTRAAPAPQREESRERKPSYRPPLAPGPNDVQARADPCAPLDLPPAVDKAQIEALVLKTQCEQTWKRQDQLMKMWPSYADARADLEKSLAAQVDGNAPTEELLRTARQLRESFWQAGGEQSATAYRYAYMARILLERAHQRDAQDMTVINELVETIQSAHPYVVFAERDGVERLVRNKEVEQTLLTLRSQQFEQVKTNVEHGACPTWEDFLCASDLSMLLSGRDNQAAQEVIEWQRRQAAPGGWTGYRPFLDKFLSLLEKGRGYNYQVYVADKGTFPEEFRYGRRLPSFQGPPGRGVRRWR